MNITAYDIRLLAIGFVIGLLAERILGYYRRESKRRLKERMDDDVFWRFKAELNAIDQKYDPNGEWGILTNPPTEYREEVRALNLKYKRMLKRRNGWKNDDF